MNQQEIHQTPYSCRPEEELVEIRKALAEIAKATAHALGIIFLHQTPGELQKCIVRLHDIEKDLSPTEDSDLCAP